MASVSRRHIIRHSYIKQASDPSVTDRQVILHSLEVFFSGSVASPGQKEQVGYCSIAIMFVDLLLMLIDLTCSIVTAILQTFLQPRLKCIEGELCLITGAGGALGRLFALEFAKEGARLVLWDCNAAANEQTAELVRELGAQAHTYTVDLSKRQSVYETADRVRAEVGCVSILVNNAGVVAGRRLLDCPDELLERTLLVNCHALFWVRLDASFYARIHEHHEAAL